MPYYNAACKKSIEYPFGLGALDKIKFLSTTSPRQSSGAFLWGGTWASKLLAAIGIVYMVHSKDKYTLLWESTRSAKIEREAEIQLEKIKLSQIEKQLELAKVRKESEKNSQSLESGEPSSITDKLESLVKSIKTLTIQVSVRSESFNLFFHSLEKAFQIKSVPDELKAEILLNILGERVNNLLTYVSQEDLSNYVKIKELILREFEPTPQECLSNFKKTRKLPSENYVQFASRLSATFDYYCQLRKVNEFRSLCDLIISDKIFETLDRDTMNHIATKQGETYFKPQQLGRECDVYLSARGKVSNDLMSRNPGSGVKTDGRNRLQTVGTWRRERNSSNVFVAETKPNCVLCKAQLVKKIHSTLRLNISDIVLHTDSTIALAWLNTPTNRLKTFVANRVAKVQELTEGFQWNHVPSVLNPADLVSRGLHPCDLPNLRLWWHGPQFLEKDSDGLLRVGGRLSNSDLPYVNKHPAILPGNHNLTVQIIVHFHRKNLHTGASSLLHYPTPCYFSAIMGNLPRDRVVPDYPFNCSAIHIEIVSDLTSDAFIATLKRFFSRRGKCAKLYSDNGKTFVGANKELKRFLKLIEDSDDNLAGFLSAEGIEWKFIYHLERRPLVVFGKLRLSQ
ncbi:integrase catalytic domain-containing protein [Trichonephila clavipes]|nr:integrase catalytic domain-containing protein [Trichonephila clavipes]